MKRIERLPVSVVQIGIGGMGYHYVRALMNDFPSGKVNLCGVVDPYPERSVILNEIKKRNVPVCLSLKELLDSGLAADLVIIASPLQHHVNQSLDALDAGSHVLCEKPLTATVQEADRLIQSRSLDSPWMRIGYQWSYTKAILELKKDNQDAQIIAHPECEKPILIVADHIGSTTSLLNYTIKDSGANVFSIRTIIITL